MLQVIRKYVYGLKVTKGESKLFELDFTIDHEVHVDAKAKNELNAKISEIKEIEYDK